jgi:hypothetical protein
LFSIGLDLKIIITKYYLAKDLTPNPLSCKEGAFLFPKLPSQQERGRG